MEEKKRILVVDDKEYVRNFMSDMLKVFGYGVTIVPGGKEALEKLTTEKFDMVITDFKMPGMNGDELLRRIKEVYLDLPVIVYSGYSDGVSSDEFLKMGAIAFLGKPFEIEYFRELIRSILLPPSD